jgi:hypothetical protein
MFIFGVTVVIDSPKYINQLIFYYMTQNINTLNICFLTSYEKYSSRFGIARLQQIQIYINSLGLVKFLKRYTRNLPSVMA